MDALFASPRAGAQRTKGLRLLDNSSTENLAETVLRAISTPISISARARLQDRIAKTRSLFVRLTRQSAEPAPAQLRVLAELQLELAIQLDHTCAMFARDPRSVVARGIDEQQLVGLVNEQCVHARDRRVVECLARIAAAVAAEQHAVAKRIVADVEHDAAARALDLEAPCEIALVTDRAARRVIDDAGVARPLRAEDVALTEIVARQAKARVGSRGAVLELVEVHA